MVHTHWMRRVRPHRNEKCAIAGWRRLPSASKFVSFTQAAGKSQNLLNDRCIDSIRHVNGHGPNGPTQDQTSIACDARKYVLDNSTETWIYDQKGPNELYLNSDPRLQTSQPKSQRLEWNATEHA